MKKYKNSIITGLVLYGIGVKFYLWDAFRSVWSALNSFSFNDNREYLMTNLVITAISFTVQLLPFIILGMLTHKFYRTNQRKYAVLLCWISGIVSLLTGVLLINAFTPAIPKYLIYSKLGIIDTYIVYFMPLLQNGILFRFIALIIFFISTIIFVRSKKDVNNETE